MDFEYQRILIARNYRIRSGCQSSRHDGIVIGIPACALWQGT